MVKKLSATTQRFSMAQKNARAAAKVQRETMLNETILTPERVELCTGECVEAVSFVSLDGEVIAAVIAGLDSVTVEFADGQNTQVTFQHVDACKSLLTYRKVAVANLFPDGAVNLSKMVRQRNAEAAAQAEAAQLAAVADSQNQSTQPQIRL